VLVIHGTVASLGWAKGIVKIVNKVSDIKKVKDGDILVSVATNLSLLPAMKKASAFVTDAGGITSHAAIVARELKKPCIIGAKLATKILKDGDMIELDTKKGDIRRLAGLPTQAGK
jgi:pyruvate,water dikinase